MQVFYIRLLRKGLIAVIVVVLVAVSFNYIQTWRRRSRIVARAAKILGAEMLRSADSIEYSENEHGVLKFKVRAQKLLETRQGKNLLQGIEAFDFNPDGSVRNHIRSQRAEYDRSAKRALFSGDVQLQMGEKIELRTESLRYDLQTNRGETDDAVKLISPEASGTARGVHYDHDQNRLELYHELDFTLKRSVKKPDGTIQAEDVHVTSQSGSYSESELYLRFQGDARLESETDVLKGNDIEATFSADRKKVSSLLCQGNASYTSKDTSVARELRGDRIRFGLVPDTGSLEKIEIFGEAGYSSRSEDGEQELRGSTIFLGLDPVKGIPRVVRSSKNVSFRMDRKNESTTVAGENLDAAFLPGAGLLDRMRVWGDAQMSSRRENETEKDDLRAEEIRLSFQDIQGRTALRRLEAERSVNWKTPPRREGPGAPLRAGRALRTNRLTIRYGAGADYPESGEAAGNVILASIPVRDGQRAEIRRLEADTVRFRFWKPSGRLSEFEGEGHVAVSYHKPADPAAEIPDQEFHTTSTNMRATLREKDGEAETVSQWGNFTYEDGARKASAGRGDYQAETEVMVLQESPKISDANGSTTGVRMEYDQRKQILTVRQRVRSVLRRTTDGEGARSGTAEKASAPTIVTADNLQFWNEESRARYSGSALLLSEDGQLRCNALEIFGGGERVEGEGDIRHLIFKKGIDSQRGPQESAKPGARLEKQPDRAKSQILIQSSRLRYFKEQNSTHYSEKVILNGEDLWMSSDSLDVVLDPEGRRVVQAAARKNVVARQAGREAKGDFGDYYVSPGKVVVTGNPAQITDPKKGKTQARRLTFFTTDDRVLFETQ